MKGKSLIRENLELAYTVWRECGQSPEETVRTLNSKHDFTVSRQTIYEWTEKFNWKERAARAEAEAQRATSATENLQIKFLADLVTQKERYDVYFTTIAPQIDNQAIYAYTNLVKAITEIDRKKVIARTADDVETLAKKGGLSKETAQQIREQILGIGK
jgi:Holliday junction resolvase RusA-like endonuclease